MSHSITFDPILGGGFCCVKMMISTGMLGLLLLSGYAQKLEDVDVSELKPICQVIAVGASNVVGH